MHDRIVSFAGVNELFKLFLGRCNIVVMFLVLSGMLLTLHLQRWKVFWL